MDTLSLKIRGNLEQHQQQTIARHSYHWKMIRLVSMVAALLVSASAFIPNLGHFRHIITLLLFSPVLLLTGLFSFQQFAPKRTLQIVLLGLIFTLLSIAGGLLYPTSPSTPAWITLFIPVISWALIGKLFQESPHQSRRYSLRPFNLGINALAGCFVGLILAIHELIIIRYIPGMQPLRINFSTQEFFWLVGILTGLVVPAEELLFRGASFSVLHDDLVRPFKISAFQITLLNILLCFSIALINIKDINLLPLMTLTLIYKSILSYCCLFIIERFRNMWATIGATFIFYLLLGQVLFL